MPSKPKAAAGLEYEDRVLAYLDILGWRDLIKRSVKDISVMDTVAAGVHSLKEAKRMPRRLKRLLGGAHEVVAPEVTVFSDTVVLSCISNVVAVKILVGEVQMFCTGLMLAGLYTRGAIVRGKLHHKNSVIIGPALIDAYLIESTVAKYPRVIVEDRLIPGTLSSLTDGITIPVDAFLTDGDGLNILNVFSGPFGPLPPDFIKNLRATAEKSFRSNFSRLDVRAKLGWLLGLFRRVIDEADQEPLLEKD